MSSNEADILDFRAIESFLAAMTMGSMTAAARHLGRSQPAVTRQIKELEESVGFSLFHRNGPRISPTERGLLFHEEADRLLAGMRQVRQRAAAIRDHRAPSLAIAATPTMSGGLVAPALARLGAEQPDWISGQTAGAEHVVRSVRARSADLGISSFPLDHAGLSVQIVCESDCVAVIPDDDPLAGEPQFMLSALTERRLVTVGNAYRLRSSIDQALERAGVRPTREFSTNTSLNAVMAARAGLGVGLVDPVTAYGIPVQGIKIMTLSVKIPYVWGLFTAADRAVSPLMDRFIRAFADTCAEIVPACRFHDPADISRLKCSA